MPRATALVLLPVDLADHYSQMAAYLRLNGMLPRRCLLKRAANPVVWSAKMLYELDSKNMIAAAEEMPADKYSYHPTPDQWTFGKVVSHIAQ